MANLMLRSQETPIMRRLLFGSLIIAAFAASSSALAVEAGSAPGADNAPSAPSGKQTKSTKPKRTAIPLSAAYDTRSTELPAASIHTSPPPPAQPLWSGTFVGVGAGVGK
jgi:hypothetical protein